MLASLITNGITLLLKGIIDGFQRKASFKSLAVCCAVLLVIGGLLIYVGTLDSKYVAPGIILIAVAACLIVLNTVFRKKSESQESADKPGDESCKA